MAMTYKARELTRIIYDACFEPGVFRDGGVTPTFDVAKGYKSADYLRARDAAEKIVQANQKGKL
jgi:hypothetical protein